MNAIPRLLSATLRILAYLLGAAFLAAALMAQGGRFSPRLDLLTHFALIWAFGGVAVLASGLFFRGAKMGMVWLGLATIAASLLLMAPEIFRHIEPRVSPNSARTVKIIQYNAWKSNADIDADVDWLISEAPDIIAVEELTPQFERSLQSRGGYHVTKGWFSSAVFSKTPTKGVAFAVDGDRRLWPDLASAKISNKLGDFDFICVHMTWPTHHYAQTFHLNHLVEVMQGLDLSKAILVGDFNLTPWSFKLQDFDQHIGLSRRDRAIFSWPAQPFLGGRVALPMALLPIDHVYAGSAWRTVSIERGPKRGSDHYPLIVVLAPRD